MNASRWIFAIVAWALIYFSTFPIVFGMSYRHAWSVPKWAMVYATPYYEIQDRLPLLKEPLSAYQSWWANHLGCPSIYVGPTKIRF
jgi:hypothetical protein